MQQLANRQLERLEALRALADVRDAYRTVHDLLDQAATPASIEVDRHGLVALLHQLNTRLTDSLTRLELAIAG